MLFRGLMRVILAIILFALGYAFHDVVAGSGGIPSSDLKLKVTLSEGNLLSNPATVIKNVGYTSVQIQHVEFNESPDCKLQTRPLPVDLKVGEYVIANASCQIVRVGVTTNLGTESYTFNESR